MNHETKNRALDIIDKVGDAILLILAVLFIALSIADVHTWELLVRFVFIGIGIFLFILWLYYKVENITPSRHQNLNS